MRRRLVIAVVAGMLAAGIGTAGCGRDTAAGGPAPAGDWPAGVLEAEVYVQVLRRYLGTPGENSFPEQSFTTVYVLDRAQPNLGDPAAKPEPGTPIAANTRQQVTAALADLADVVFIADRATALKTKDGCEQVKDGGILITLGTVDGDDNEAKVALHGYVACLGATWLTYVVRNEAGTGWRVTGTTGSAAIS